MFSLEAIFDFFNEALKKRYGITLENANIWKRSVINQWKKQLVKFSKSYWQCASSWLSVRDWFSSSTAGSVLKTQQVPRMTIPFWRRLKKQSTLKSRTWQTQRQTELRIRIKKVGTIDRRSTDDKEISSVVFFRKGGIEFAQFNQNVGNFHVYRADYGSARAFRHSDVRQKSRNDRYAECFSDGAHDQSRR